MRALSDSSMQKAHITCTANLLSEIYCVGCCEEIFVPVGIQIYYYILEVIKKKNYKTGRDMINENIYGRNGRSETFWASSIIIFHIAGDAATDHHVVD